MSKLFIEFFESKRASGVILILCTIFSIAIANSDVGKVYLDFWHIKIGFEIGETFFSDYNGFGGFQHAILKNNLKYIFNYYYYYFYYKYNMLILPRKPCAINQQHL